ncbi:hypothetical protein SeseC_01677 [Streptococcus equi subsp. zooepidemicus ATCC 35246]|nr:hypothetical protein SeseC_01677 [Streptococcus equi subsp. zooepidemicus ATCC 35246]
MVHWSFVAFECWIGMIMLDFYFREDFRNEAKAQDTFDKDRSTYDS